MGRFRKYMFESEADRELISDEHYNMAYKKVKRIKGFYSHLRVYLIINVLLIISNLSRNFIGSGFNEERLFEWHTYSTALFWGIGLLAHALSVYGRDIFFSDAWEERKIKEIMDKKSANTKWQ
ncbi:2TM domain-containing protein [Flavobacterium sp. Fl-77]|uniref:2TM domain-containing protein n=1 Tax=Flavobacterium flavipigmentatum TaxID=2893884 RepID=A0AAJ2VYW6_9FLAO|nr:MULTISPECIES: 2TM domain-containing protein [unclassified Flavobacterium]MDX6183375.1 2TM domain-containing protein [Flavobacterium sp. Fl-33]MDX6186659.1 2TM domain-containing protein [Flavobacterium sp. Fl-77]UFH38573.1 2TM domain-containing protein [Flavobacterium sp. F-70]